MKPNIHPEYKDLIIKRTDGTTFTTKSTRGGELLMDVDFTTSPAWTGALMGANTASSNIQEFEDKFGGFLGDFGLSDTKK